MKVDICKKNGTSALFFPALSNSRVPLQRKETPLGAPAQRTLRSLRRQIDIGRRAALPAHQRAVRERWQVAVCLMGAPRLPVTNQYLCCYCWVYRAVTRVASSKIVVFPCRLALQFSLPRLLFAGCVMEEQSARQQRPLRRMCRVLFSVIWR